MTDTRLLDPTPTLDFGHPAVAAFARKHAEGAATDVERAVRLFLAVRDGVLYDPYTCVPTVEAMKASATLARGRAWCVPKAILLAACCRAVGIPAKLGYTDVKNHLSTERLRELMGTDVYAWHGYVSMRLAGRWVKATPAFNAVLCRRFGLLPVDFDGVHDSLLHPTDASGRDHIEYVRERGEYDDAPVEEIRATFVELYPRLLEDAERGQAKKGPRPGSPGFM